MDAPRLFTLEQQVLLWKWFSESRLTLQRRYAKRGEPEYDEDREEQLPNGFYVTEKISAYDGVVGEGVTDLDAIASARLTMAIRSNGIGYIYRGMGASRSERFEQEYWDGNKKKSMVISNLEATVLINNTLKKGGFDFLCKPLEPILEDALGTLSVGEITE